MFEKFTEKAINVVSTSQKIAQSAGISKVTPEDLLLALFDEAKGISLKIFKSYGITHENLTEKIAQYRKDKAIESIKILPLPFNDEYKEILKKALDLPNKSGNPTILYEHLFLSVISDKKSNNVKILEDLGFDIYKSKSLLEKLVQKKTKRLYHPEIDEHNSKSEDKAQETDDILKNKSASKVF